MQCLGAEDARLALMAAVPHKGKGLRSSFILIFRCSLLLFACFSTLPQRENLWCFWHSSLYCQPRELLWCHQAPFSLVLQGCSGSTRHLLPALPPVPYLDGFTACTFPNTAFVQLYHTSATASVVTFTYLCSSASQNALQAGFAVTKCVTRTVRPAGLF